MFNCMSVISMLGLSIIIEFHNKSVYFVLVYTQDDVKTDIFLEFPIVFAVERGPPQIVVH